jgi:CrcB protein
LRKYIYIGLGGCIGAVFRVIIENSHLNGGKGFIPLNTLLINITGSFLIAVVLTLAYEVLEMEESLRLGITTGFLGGYTTFSTLCKETVNLINKRHGLVALEYVLLSIFLGLSAVYLGTIVARELIAKIIKNSETNVE